MCQRGGRGRTSEGSSVDIGGSSGQAGRVAWGRRAGRVSGHRRSARGRMTTDGRGWRMMTSLGLVILLPFFVLAGLWPKTASHFSASRLGEGRARRVQPRTPVYGNSPALHRRASSLVNDTPRGQGIADPSFGRAANVVARDAELPVDGGGWPGRERRHPLPDHHLAGLYQLARPSCSLLEAASGVSVPFSTLTEAFQVSFSRFGVPRDRI